MSETVTIEIEGAEYEFRKVSDLNLFDQLRAMALITNSIAQIKELRDSIENGDVESEKMKDLSTSMKSIFEVMAMCSEDGLQADTLKSLDSETLEEILHSITD